MKTSVLFGFAALLSTLTSAADYNLGELVRANKIELFNRNLSQPKADSPETIFLNAAANDGVAWVTGLEFSEGTVEVEIKGKNEQGRSFVGIAFHGQDNRAFDAVYLRPFNFKAGEEVRRSHSIQYVSMPEYDWNKLRNSHPGKYEFPIAPAPDPDSWVKLKLVIKEKNVAAYVNGSDTAALNVELLNDHPKGKLGLWVGNGSDGCFKNLKVIPASK
ncbi:MAG TPA: hypothetical protein VL361_24310 [Candidatus Limnocylindrales bacterium]|jgi:hypothetical protein|nr:hypothetical protein [Candidatus Limnocylindrales bacterium]